MVVANERAIGLFHGEHMEQASRGVNLELPRITSAATIRDARCAEFDEVLWVSDSMEWDGVYWDHVFKVVESLESVKDFFTGRRENLASRKSRSPR